MALLVTFLWSSSFVLVKVGLKEMDPLPFAAMRYALAFAALGAVDLASRTSRRLGSSPSGSARVGHIPLLVAGICGYTVAQGLQFVGLYYLPAVTTSFLLNFNPLFVLVLGAALLSERVSVVQLVGTAVALGGAYAFFYGRLAFPGDWLGVAIVLISGLGWAAYLLVVRKLQGSGPLDSLRFTTVTMGIGTLGLIMLGAVFGGYSIPTFESFLIIFWLGLVNTALPFFLWNRVLLTLPPFELSVLQNTMLVQIAVLAAAFLAETITQLMMAGMALVLLGVVFVQVPALKGLGGGAGEEDTETCHLAHR